MLFRQFIDLSMDALVWDVTVFTKNRERRLEGEGAVSFLLAVMGDALVNRLLSTEHFAVDGTLIDAGASMKSFRRKDGQDEAPAGPGRNAERAFKGENRSNESYASTTDPDARLFRKSDGQPSRSCFMGHLLIENRHGLIVDVRTTHATGRAEREAAEAIIQAATQGRRVTLGAEKAYDAAEHIAHLRSIGVTPHVAQKTLRRRSAIDGRTTRRAGYGSSQRLRKRIERPSAGSSRRRGCVRRAIAVCPGSAGPSP